MSSSAVVTRSFRDNLQKHLIGSPTLKELLANNARLDHEQFVAKVIGTIMGNVDLQKCSVPSIMECCVKSAQLGLPVDASGYAYIIPRSTKKDNSWVVEATYQIGYRGYLELAKRNKDVKSIDSFVVYKEEVLNGNFCEIRGSESKIIYKPDYSIVKTDDNVAIVVAIISYINGGQEWEVMTKDEINKAKSVSVKKDCNGKDRFSPWTDWWCEMAKKTVLRRLLKRCCLMNIDTAIDLDEDEQWKNDKKEVNSKSINDIVGDYDITQEEKSEINNVESANCQNVQSVDVVKLD